MSKQDLQVNRRIINFLEERIANLDDPSIVGDALKVRDFVNFGNIGSAIVVLFAIFNMKL